MPQVWQVMEALERVAPKRFAFSFDKVGLQVGDRGANITRGVVSLDRSLGAVSFASAKGAQMLISHHPLIFEPIGSVLAGSHIGRTVLELAKGGIAFAAAHTNWDSAKGGINDELARRLGLTNVRAFGSAAAVRKLKLVVFCPPADSEKIIDAASEAGAGVIGAYSRCAYMSEGHGTFLGGEGSNPTIGSAGMRETVDELRVEMVLAEDRARAVTKAVRKAHSYEEPAFDFFQLAASEEQPAGRMGHLAAPLTFRELLTHTNSVLDTASWAWGDPERRIQKVAVIGGAADSEWRNAREAGADAMVTGEVKQHVGLEAAEEGFAILASGHYATEHPGCEALRERLAVEVPDVEWLVYAPEPGFSGRPFVR